MLGLEMTLGSRVARWAVLMSALVAGGCGGDDDCSDPVANRCEAVDPGARGPFAVGALTWELTDPARVEDGAPRSLRVEVWYPAIDDGGEVDAYDLIAEAPDELAPQLEGLEALFAQDAVRDATPDFSAAPYPVVLFSHGNGGVRFQNFGLMTHLASHGFVVVAPDHTGNTLWDGLAGRLNFESVLASFPQRFGDMPFVGEAVVATTGPLAGLADTERWAVMGHSFGGTTALALTEASRGIEPDPRFRVAVPMTPGVGILPILGFDTLRSRVPVLFFGAQLDRTIPWESDQLPGYERAAEPKILAAATEAGHFSYTELCRPELEAIAAVVEEDISSLLADGCGPEFIGAGEMLQMQRWLATSFLNGYLRDSPPALRRLAPDALPASVASVLDYRVQGVPTD